MVEVQRCEDSGEIRKEKIGKPERAGICTQKFRVNSEQGLPIISQSEVK